jgi:hypothetical protein
MSLRHTAIVSGALILLPAGSLAAQDHPHHGGPERLGRVEFATSCIPDRHSSASSVSLALLHSFWWSEAERAFAGRAGGRSWLRHRPLGAARSSTGATGSPGRRAAEATTRGHRRRWSADSPCSRRVRSASATTWRRSPLLFRGAGSSASHRARCPRLRGSDGRAACPLSRTTWRPPSSTLSRSPPMRTPADRTFERQRRAGAILEPHFRAHPEHPGLAHYLIHTYDAPPIAHLGEEAARVYGEIAPVGPPCAAHAVAHLHSPRPVG